MQLIMRYQADDGAVFSTPEAARERDELIRIVNEAMIPLGPEYDDDTCDYANGYGYVQHSEDAVAQARANLMPITRKILAWWFEIQPKDHGKDPVDCHPQWYCRMLDGTHDPLDDAWRRICRIDKQNREWGQQSYADDGAPPEKTFEIKREAN
jgi:hypothetical protein